MEQIVDKALTLKNYHITIRDAQNTTHEYPIPVGLLVSKKKNDFWIEKKENSTKIYVTPKGSRRSKENTSQIYPTYEANDEDVTLWIANKYGDIVEGRYLIEKGHYLKAPSRGVFLMLKFKDKDSLKNHLDKNINVIENNKNLKNCLKWDTNRIVGCLVLDRMYHGNPNGRKTFWQKEIRKHKIDPARGSEIISKLSLHWISRVVVEKRFVQQGLGGILIQNILSACNFTYPIAGNVEMIRTVKSSRAKDILKFKNDWACEGGLTPVNKNYSPPPWLPGPEGHRVRNTLEEGERITYEKIYYAAKIKSR